jgi:hypothetical protein
MVTSQNDARQLTDSATRKEHAMEALLSGVNVEYRQSVRPALARPGLPIELNKCIIEPANSA